MRAAALRRLIDAPEEQTAALASEAGFNLALPLFAVNRRDAADTAIAALGRDRAIHLRILFQAGIGLLLVVCFATANSPITHLMAIVAAVAAAPTWVLALGAPDAIASLVLTSPIFGTPARQLLHARLLATLALFLGLGAEPPLARAIAERFVGAPLPDAAIAKAIAPGGSFAGKVVLREESEGALLRASARLERAAQVRVRMVYLAITAVTLAAVFAPALREAANLRNAKPVPTRIDEDERPGFIVIGTNGAPQ